MKTWQKIVHLLTENVGDLFKSEYGVIIYPYSVSKQRLRRTGEESYV